MTLPSTGDAPLPETEGGRPAVAMIPPRPLRLRRDYLRAMRRRIAVVIAASILTIVVGLAWPGSDLAEAWRLESTWRRAEPLDVVRVDVEHARVLGWLHSVDTIVVHRDATGERVAVAESFRSPWPPELTVAPEARRDRASGRVLTSVGVAARMARLTTAALVLGLLATCALFLLISARRRTRELSVARRAAKRSEEIVLELVGPPRRGRYTFEAPAREDPRGGYREPARAGRAKIEVRVRNDEPSPLLLGTERTCALALRTVDGEILVLRERLWPLELAVEESTRAGERIDAWRADEPS